jgi:hypothetical protein
LAGENWYLIGDTCGFADPILSAGMTLAMMGARQIAYTILATERNQHPHEWLVDYYNQAHRARIRQHIQFADFWYTSNGQFTDLIDYTKTIAERAGLELTPDAAFRWLGTGGFAHEDPAMAMVGGFAIPFVQKVNEKFSQQEAQWQVALHNRFRLNLDGATEDSLPILYEGGIFRKRCFRRGGKTLPCYGLFDIVMKLLQKEEFIVPAVERLTAFLLREKLYETPEAGIQMTLSTMEAMITDGWVTASIDPSQPFYNFSIPEEASAIHPNRDFVGSI